METEFRSIETCVERAIEAHRGSIDPSTLLDVAVGLDALTGEERRDAVLGMCGSLVECQLRGLVDRVVRQSAERLLQDATIEIAALAIALHGPAEARALFPIRLPMPDSSTARRSGGSS